MFPQVDLNGSKSSSPRNAHHIYVDDLQRLVSAADLADGRDYSMHPFE